MKTSNQTIAVCHAFDTKVEFTIDTLMRRYNITPVAGEYPNIALSAVDTMNIFNSIREDFISSYSSETLKNIIITDYGIGIGNVPELMMRAVVEDKVFGKDLVRSLIIGFDRELIYLDHCRFALANISRELKLQLTDLSDKEDLKDCLALVNHRTKGYMEQGRTLNIAYCNRPFRELNEQYELEYEILKNSPIGTYFVNPMRVTLIGNVKGIRVINANIIKKTAKW